MSVACATKAKRSEAGFRFLILIASALANVLEPDLWWGVTCFMRRLLCQEEGDTMAELSTAAVQGQRLE